MECPITVADPKVSTAPIQDRVQLLDYQIDAPIGWEWPHDFANPQANVAARLFAVPHVQQSPCSLPELETQEREPFFKRCQPALLLVHHQSKGDKLFLKSFPHLL